MNMPIRILVSYLCLLLAVVASAQTLSVNHFDIDTKFDLSAKMNMVKDLNGIPCSLVKLSSLDSITKIEGNVIQKVDKDIESWLYLPVGTKYLKIYTLHHTPLDIFVHNYIPDGLQSNSVYQLELKSDLPPEILFGSSDATCPVKMESKDSPLLPEWYDVRKDDLYVGMSCPSYDAKSAKKSALANAICLYGITKGMETRGRIACDYYEGTDTESDKIYVAYENILAKFSLQLYQEYYNSKGEYFVLCQIQGDSTSQNRMRRVIDFEDDIEGDKIEGRFNTYMAAEIYLDKTKIQLDSSVTRSWNKENMEFQVGNGSEILYQSNKKITDLQESGFFKVEDSFGVAQTRALAFLPPLSGILQSEDDDVHNRSTEDYNSEGDIYRTAEEYGSDGEIMNFYLAYHSLKSFLSHPYEISIVKDDKDQFYFSIKDPLVDYDQSLSLHKEIKSSDRLSSFRQNLNYRGYIGEDLSNIPILERSKIRAWVNAYLDGVDFLKQNWKGNYDLEYEKRAAMEKKIENYAFSHTNTFLLLDADLVKDNDSRKKLSKFFPKGTSLDKLDNTVVTFIKIPSD